MQECNGYFYRGHRCRYISKQGDIVEKISLVPLKKESCSSNCFDYDLCEGTKIINFFKVQEGKKYQLVVANTSKDFETGYYDYDLKLIEKT